MNSKNKDNKKISLTSTSTLMGKEKLNDERYMFCAANILSGTYLPTRSDSGGGWNLLHVL